MVGVLVPVAVAEAAMRDDLSWRWGSLAVALVLFPTLLWRRTHPLPTVALCFTAMAVLGVVQIVGDLTDPPGLFSMAVLLLPLYALFRWGSGRDALVGTPLVFATTTICVAADSSGIGDVIGGYLVIGITIAIGVAIRFRGRARQRELEQVRLRERADLARDLHDTVAHHVSAIAIRAQAGIAVAPARPEAAIDALHVIEAEASRTLAEMRAMVGVLRRDEPAALSPTPTLADLHRLAGTAGGLPVAVSVSGGIDDLPPAIATAVFRLAQESVTNAQRHAREASRIDIAVSALGDKLLLRVTDDGAPVNGRRDSGGYGIIGMAERAHLLGGAVTAGPGPGRGWVVAASIPRQGPCGGAP